MSKVTKCVGRVSTKFSRGRHESLVGESFGKEGHKSLAGGMAQSLAG